ncbi:MAG TPA: YciI family protein [Polyangiaceae bacterium]|nr:YciI family protein [Polyangiaceae bacterium]
MTQYMLMVLEDEAAHAALPAKAVAGLIEKRAAFEDELRRAGVLKDSGQLRPSKEGRRIRRAGGRLEEQPGPFAEDGKALGGYLWVEAQTAEDAAKVAGACPTLEVDEVDVRPLMKGSLPQGTLEQPGKIFACAVLGNAATEDAWVEVMDRIDAETKDRFPLESILGGVRLQPPRSGRRVAMRGERRASFDGPFLESKEVIGGIFFLRMASIEDAVRWAGETGFVVHGALEIRERWRT